MQDKIFKTLSQASSDVMLDKVEHIVISWTTSDGQVHTVYDKKPDASFVEMLGGLEMLKTRVLHGYCNIPELDNGEDDG